eukprot:gene11666-biopygen7835
MTKEPAWASRGRVRGRVHHNELAKGQVGFIDAVGMAFYGTVTGRHPCHPSFMNTGYREDPPCAPTNSKALS